MSMLHWQSQLSHSIRHQDAAVPEGISERAMAVYRDLFFNNVLSFIDGTFPVAEKIISHQFGRQQWLLLVADFVRDYHCTSPLFLEIPQHFLDYVSEAEIAWLPEWFYELAHYEWLELAVDIDPVTIEYDFDANADLAAAVPVLAAAAQGYLYRYPVHTISESNPNPDPQETALIVYRNRQDEVQFIASNPLTLALLAQLQLQPSSGKACIEQVLNAAGQPLTDAALQGGLAIFEQWRQQGLILGGRIDESS